MKIILLAILCGLALSQTVHWIFIHYHKTGHHLARKLSEVFMSKPCYTTVSHQFDRRVPIQNLLPKIILNNISVLAAPDVQLPWNDSILGEINGSVRIIHFVRDPFEMVISAYLYHSQFPSPAGEVWLSNKLFNPCDLDYNETFDTYAKILANHSGNYSNISDLLTSTVNICNDLTSIYQDNANVSNYNELMRALSPTQALILEATRSILSHKGGDILRMGVNSLFERSTTNGKSKRFFLSDFPVGNRPEFVKSSTNMFSYLIDKTEGFWSCIDIHAAVRRSIQLAYVDTTNATSHVTQTAISAQHRQVLREHLMAHAVLGPLLNIVNEIVSN